MSKKGAKTDLLVRVRYANPLPPPPFPPRLLHIDTNPQRYATYDFLNPLINERELSLVLDAELGMPLEYGKVAKGEHAAAEYWTGGRSKIAPPKEQRPTPHVDDAFMLEGTGSNVVPGFLSSTPSGMGERKRVDVSWLRRTEYLSSEAGSKVLTGNVGLGSAKAPIKPVIELTRQTRCDAIKATFTASSAPLSTLKHPTRGHLKAEESFDILPDVALWPNTLNLVRFGEDPGEGTSTATGAVDARLPRAVFRPVDLPGDAARIGYYLPVDQTTAIAYEKRRRDGQEGAPEDEAFDFKYVRDYEVANQRPLKEEFVFCFDDGLPQPELDANGEPIPESDSRPTKRPRGAYYARLGSAQTLRKRRPRRNEDHTVFPKDAEDAGLVFWDGISMKVRGVDVLGEDEEESKDRVAMEHEVNTAPTRL